MRFALQPVLLIIIMSIITGNTAYREIARFPKANKNLFLKFFQKLSNIFIKFRENLAKI